MEPGSYPQLMVRPPVDPRMIPYLKGNQGFRSAATITFGKTRQSKREAQRMLDNAKRRAEIEWRLSAEPVLVGSFPSFSSLATKSFPLVGALIPGQELREFQVIVEGTLKINAATGIIKAPDHNILYLAILKKLRASLYGNNDAFNLTPQECRTIAFTADNRDMARQDPNLRLGTGLTTSAFNTKIKLKIPFTARSLEVPEIFSLSTDQAMLPGSKVDIDTQGDALTTIALTDGSSTFVVTDVKLYAVCNQVPVLHAGPPMLWRSKQITQTRDTEAGMAVDLFVGTEEAATATGGGARIAQFTVRRDGRPQPLNVDPVTLAQQFNESQFSADGLAALDITTGGIPFGGVATAAAPIPDGAIGTQLGAQVVPLEWNDGKIRAGAWQWPFYLSSRQIEQNVVAGQSPSINVLYWQVRPIYECAGQVVNLAAQNGLSIRDVDQLKTRGGNDGDTNYQLKGRFMQLKPVKQRS